MCSNWKSDDHVNKPHGWSLPQEERDEVGYRYFDSVIECIVCGCKFSLLRKNFIFLFVQNI